MAHHALALRRALREAGRRSELFVSGTGPGFVAGTPAADYVRHAAFSDCLVVHYVDGRSPALAVPRTRRLVLDYHGPRRLLRPADPASAKGRAGGAPGPLARLARRAVLGLGHHPEAVAAVQAAGCRQASIGPLLVPALGGAPADTRVSDRLAATSRSAGPEWLHLGPLVPEQAQDDMVKALWVHRRLYGPARLHLVGAPADRTYAGALRGLADALDLEEAVRFPGDLPDAAVAAYLDRADCYLSLRPDPVADAGVQAALRRGVPIVARSLASTGLPALPLHGAGPVTVAAALHRVASEPRVAEALRQAGSSWLTAEERKGGAPALAELVLRAASPVAMP